MPPDGSRRDKPTAAPIDLLTIDTARRVGGGQVTIERVLRRLDPGAFRVTLACPQRSGLAARFEELPIALLPWIPPSRSPREGPGDVLASGPSRRLLLAPAAAIAIARLALWARGRERLVIHANTFQAGVLGAVLSRLVHRPLVFHDRILKNHGAIERWVYRSAAAAFAITRGVSEKWSAEFADKTVLLVDGTDLEHFRPRGDRSLRERLGIAPETLVLLAISRISREKGLEVLIEAAGRLGRGVAVIVVGEPFLAEDRAYQREIEALCQRLGVPARFLGFQSNVVPALEAADVFVLASHAEPFGQVVLEAMAMEKPVLVARSGGPLEFVEDGRTGVFFSPRDAGDLAARLDALWKDPGRRLALGQEARRVVRERYGLDGTVQGFRAVIRSLAETGRPPVGDPGGP
jgi:glycosyltransferase involved in cell wall biosynthesis